MVAACVGRPVAAMAVLLTLLGSTCGERQRLEVKPHDMLALQPRSSTMRRLLSSAGLLALARSSSADGAGDQALLSEILEVKPGEYVSKEDFLASVGVVGDAPSSDPEAEGIRVWWEGLFDKADVDNDNQLAAAEVRYLSFLANEAWTSMSKATSEEIAGDHIDWLKSLIEQDVGESSMLERFDANGDGYIDKAEFMSAASDLIGEGGVKADEGLQDFFETAFAEADVSGDGLLDANEAGYLQYMIREAIFPSDFDAAFATEDDEMRDVLFDSIYEVLDRNDDGKVTEEEFHSAVGDMHNANAGKPPAFVTAFKEHFAKAEGDDSERSFDKEMTMRLLKEAYPPWGTEF
mmetsp:Transcript_16529/g.47957  ORF Transcript_16529/g.47957 Transcript_16529/m.47957 type:complete len:349 (-) Transcript_16529:64-1110(-)